MDLMLVLLDHNPYITYVVQRCEQLLNCHAFEAAGSQNAHSPPTEMI